MNEGSKTLQGTNRNREVRNPFPLGREGCQKLKELFPERYDPKLTEYENMLNFGYDRIWDCGNYKFVLTKIKV